MQVLQRIAATTVEAFAAALVFVPILLILNKFFFRNLKRTLIYCIFAFYLSAIYAVVGLPTAYNFKFEFFLYLIPLVGMMSDVLNSILNVLLFVPLGFFLPLLCKSFHKAKNTLLFGFCSSFVIELLQLFAHRKTDVNDLITNTLGTFFGFLLASLILKKRTVGVDGSRSEIFAVAAVIFLIMFFAQPLVSAGLFKLLG